jgi:hypothetical protein
VCHHGNENCFTAESFDVRSLIITVQSAGDHVIRVFNGSVSGFLGTADGTALTAIALNVTFVPDAGFVQFAPTCTPSEAFTQSADVSSSGTVVDSTLVDATDSLRESANPAVMATGLIIASLRWAVTADLVRSFAIDQSPSRPWTDRIAESELFVVSSSCRESALSQSSGFDHSVRLIVTVPTAVSGVFTSSRPIAVSLTFHTSQAFERSSVVDRSPRGDVSGEFRVTGVAWESDEVNETDSFAPTQGSASGSLSDSTFLVESGLFSFSNVFSAPSFDSTILSLISTFSPPSSAEAAEFTAAATARGADIVSGSAIGIGIGAGIAALVVVAIICVVLYVLFRYRNLRSQAPGMSDENELPTDPTVWAESMNEAHKFASNENILASDEPRDLFDPKDHTDEG